VLADSDEEAAVQPSLAAPPLAADPAEAVEPEGSWSMPLGLCWPLPGEEERAVKAGVEASAGPALSGSSDWLLAGLSGSEEEEADSKAAQAGGAEPAAGAGALGFSWPLLDVEGEEEEEAVAENDVDSEEWAEEGGEGAAGQEEVEFWVSNDVWLYDSEEDGEQADASDEDDA
jgi:hypothetical protein